MPDASSRNPGTPDPDMLVELCAARHEIEARALVSTLHEEGIPAEVFSRHLHALHAELGGGGGLRVMVRREDLAMARDVIAEWREAHQELDWDQVDVGAPEEELAPPPEVPQPNASHDGVPPRTPPALTPAHPPLTPTPARAASVPAGSAESTPSPPRTPRPLLIGLLATLALAGVALAWNPWAGAAVLGVGAAALGVRRLLG